MSTMSELDRKIKAAADQPAPTDFDYLQQQLRDRPGQMRSLRKSLNDLQIAEAAKKEQLAYLEAGAAAEAAEDKANSNADKRKAAAKLILSKNPAYIALKGDLALLDSQRNDTQVALYHAQDVFNAAKAEARLLAAMMGGCAQ